MKSPEWKCGSVLWVGALVAACTTGSIEGDQMATDASTSVDSGSAVADAAVAPADCKEALTFYGVQWTEGPANRGISDPITATVPIRGITYRVLGAANPRPTLYGDCTLVRSLAEAAPIMAERGVVEVADLGIYNYRCIGGGTPPDCPNGISQHAYAKAIDIAGVTDGGGIFYSVNDDWVIDPDSEDTCTAATVEGKDRYLHELICALKAAKVWNIVLTPNYNAAHRNHFHVDLTPNADFIERSLEPAHVGH